MMFGHKRDWIMKRMLKKIGIIILCMLLMTSMFSFEIFAESMTAEKMSLCVDGGQSYPVRVLNVSYENNRYVSLGDINVALKGTAKEFSISRGDAGVNISVGDMETTQENALDESASVDEEDSDIAPETSVDYSSWGNSEYGVVPATAVGFGNLKVNGDPVRYYHVDFDGDCFFTLHDLEFILDVTFEFAGEDMMTVDTSKPVILDPSVLEMQDFFFGVNTALVGDVSTGDIFYAFNEKNAYPIASTTKLMTYLVIMEAISNGEISMADVVQIPPEAAKLSKNGDVVIPLKAGTTASMADLLDAILLPSSNEAALTLAIHLSGSEEEFVKRMNETAQRLEMDTAHFYNCNGLPVFADEVVAAKHQNNMSGEDMFKMCSYILNNYPQITTITSKKNSVLASFDNKEVKNTNQLLYNMSEVTGLKTGTTDKSGACLVSSLKVNDGKLDHDLVVVVLGAEDNKMRFRCSQLLATYGKGVVQGSMLAAGVSEDSQAEERPVSAKAIVNYVVNYAVKNSRQ